MKNIEQEFVPYVESLELKNLGFDEQCFGVYSITENFQFIQEFENQQYINNSNEIIEKCKSISCTAPLFQQAFEYFRKKYKLEGLILPQDKSALLPLPSYFIAVISYRNQEWKELFNSTNEHTLLHYITNEDAELACLKKLIEIVKTL